MHSEQGTNHTGESAVVSAEDRERLDLLCFRNLMAHSSDIIYFKDAESRYLRISLGTANVYGVDDPIGEEGRSDFDHYAAEHARLAHEQEASIIESGEPMIDWVEHQRWPDRPDTWVSSTKMPLRDEDGTIIGTFGISRDVTEKVIADGVARDATAALECSLEQLRRVEEELRGVLEASPDALLRFDRDLRLKFANMRAARMLNLESDQIAGRAIPEITALPGRCVDALTAALTRCMAELTETEFEMEFENNVDGIARWVQARAVPEVAADGSAVGAIVAARDLSHLKAIERELEQRAQSDPLTGVFNRGIVVGILEKALARLDRDPGWVAVLFIDMDGFKSVNDTYGHDTGDLLLKKVAKRLVRTCRAHDSVARFGGDEFLVICDGLSGHDDVTAITGRIMKTLERAYDTPHGRLSVGCSIGVAMTSDPYADPEYLLKHADTQMYAVKAHGGGDLQISQRAGETTV